MDLTLKQRCGSLPHLCYRLLAPGRRLCEKNNFQKSFEKTIDIFPKIIIIIIVKGKDKNDKNRFSN